MSGFMDASYIDGVPGKRTYWGMQLYAQKNDNYRYKVDGIVGPNTWAGFRQSLIEDVSAMNTAKAAAAKAAAEAEAKAKAAAKAAADAKAAAEAKAAPVDNQSPGQKAAAAILAAHGLQSGMVVEHKNVPKYLVRLVEARQAEPEVPEYAEDTFRRGALATLDGYQRVARQDRAVRILNFLSLV
jgi:hypothetical protein